MRFRLSKRCSVESRSRRRQKIPAVLVLAAQFFAQTGKGGHGYLSFRSRVVLNEVEDLTRGFGLFKLNRMTHDRGQVPRFARDDTPCC